ncbi:MAG: GGDEF domain-containing protein [Gemmatimonadetes bacterium]|nr:GGDEF domain-containing protein [Gemmatimonadota bacterium]
MAQLTPVRRRLITLGGALVLTLGIYWANITTPPAVKLGLFYLVPILIATWFEGLGWGVVFVAASTALRMDVELEQQADSSLPISLVNQASFAMVAGITMFAFQHMKRTQMALHTMATHDPLTRVLNARAFSQRVTQELERIKRYKRPLSVLYLDLDNFKTLNDTLGHQTGDAVLRLVADAMRQAVRQADVVGRLGGDEFAVLMPETDGPLADAAATRLATSLRNAFNSTPPVTASIGVVSVLDADTDSDKVLGTADRAMYEAKRAGKDRVVKVAL